MWAKIDAAAYEIDDASGAAWCVSKIVLAPFVAVGVSLLLAKGSLFSDVGHMYVEI